METLELYDVLAYRKNDYYERLVWAKSEDEALEIMQKYCNKEGMKIKRYEVYPALDRTILYKKD